TGRLGEDVGQQLWNRDAAMTGGAPQTADLRGRLAGDFRKLGGDLPRHEDHLARDGLRRFAVRGEIPGRCRSYVAVAAPARGLDAEGLHEALHRGDELRSRRV